MGPARLDGLLGEFLRDTMEVHPNQPTGFVSENLETFFQGITLPGDPEWEFYAFQPDHGPRRLRHVQIPGKWYTLESPCPYPTRFIGRWGQSGWDHVHSVSRFATFEFDDIAGHPTTGIPTDELDWIADRFAESGLCDVRRSTGGRGIHIRAPVEPIYTPDRATYTRVRRGTLQYLINRLNLPTDLDSKVDWSRGILWVWSNTL